MKKFILGKCDGKTTYIIICYYDMHKNESKKIRIGLERLKTTLKTLCTMFHGVDDLRIFVYKINIENLSIFLKLFCKFLYYYLLLISSKCSIFLASSVDMMTVSCFGGMTFTVNEGGRLV